MLHQSIQRRQESARNGRPGAAPGPRCAPKPTGTTATPRAETISMIRQTCDTEAAGPHAPAPPRRWRSGRSRRPSRPPEHPGPPQVFVKPCPIRRSVNERFGVHCHQPFAGALPNHRRHGGNTRRTAHRKANPPSLHRRLPPRRAHLHPLPRGREYLVGIATILGVEHRADVLHGAQVIRGEDQRHQRHLLHPMPCSPVRLPPSFTHSRRISRPAATTRSVWSRSRSS